VVCVGVRDEHIFDLRRVESDFLHAADDQVR
jgi:hypothetical protein